MHRISILTLLILSASVAAADFTKFRGSAAGHAAIALPQKWSADSNIAWRTEIKGEGWSSPIIDGQRVYVTAAIPNEENSDELQLSLLAFSTKDGSLKMSKPIFTQAADAPKIHRKNSHASPTTIIEKTAPFRRPRSTSSPSIAASVRCMYCPGPMSRSR